MIRRREFVHGLSVAGMAGLLGWRPESAEAEPPPETTKLRIVRRIRDLKGKTVAVPDLGGSQHVFLASMMAYVGLDPRKDVNWVTHPHAESVRLLGEGKIDALMAIPPESQELRAKKIGHVLVNT